MSVSRNQVFKELTYEWASAIIAIQKAVATTILGQAETIKASRMRQLPALVSHSGAEVAERLTTKRL